MKNVKILISCHKPSETISNEVLTPIQVGSATASFRLPDILHDDTGDNISTLNKQYCELTAQYWAWKNLDADYYGFFHYRRYLSFCNADIPYDRWENQNIHHLTEETEKYLGLDPETLRQICSQYDVILPEEKDLSMMPNQGATMREQFYKSSGLFEKDLNIMLDVIAEKYPEYTETAKEYLDQPLSVLNNMFIMRKDIFFAFSQWEFDILEECRKRIDISDYSVEAIRTLGHLAERLVNIYCRFLKKHTKFRFAEFPTVCILNTEPPKQLKPAYPENNVAIVLSANDYYVPYVSVVLLSIKNNISKANNYDIIILTRDISELNQQRLIQSVSDTDNMSVRFYNIERYASQFEHLYLRGHFHVETYYRLLLPEVFPDYQKMLYLDSDLVVNADPAELYQADISGYLLAASRDADTAGLYNGFEPNKKKYMDEILKIEHPYEYFQAGVIVFNLEEFRKTYTSEEMLSFAASYQWELLDQDVLNYLAQGRYKAVDMAWNVMTNWRGIRIPQIISKAPKYLYEEYMTAYKAPKIIHFAGPDKPWHIVDSDYAEIFWHYARQSCYYELLLWRLSNQVAQSIDDARGGLLEQLKTGLIRKPKSIMKEVAPQLTENLREQKHHFQEKALKARLPRYRFKVMKWHK